MLIFVPFLGWLLNHFLIFRLIKGLLYFSIFNRSEFSVQKNGMLMFLKKCRSMRKNCSLIS
ncbi:hypothetical protein LEP1GSC038_4409 [Leptospira weilii str. 2006001855]|uniref:Uncharacterized protein n=1 Tax=Leptospira weilii str. 2006001855 TaxID=996804 RepID=M6G6U3_9LEPT|nr:hypothetical protein LEP1GSC038_4409 [Leptospira weilii str. 2006001855]